MTDDRVSSTKMRPHFEDIQAHYDISDDFFRAVSGSVANLQVRIFEREDMTLEEAQMAKMTLRLASWVCSRG